MTTMTLPRITPIALLLGAIGGILAIIGFVVSLDLGLPWLMPVLMIGVGILGAMFKRPQVWIGVYLFAMPYFLTDTGKGLSAAEVAIGGFFSVSIIVWLVWRMAVTRAPVIKTWADFLILLFIVLSGLNVIPALCNGVDPMSWTSEWILFFLMLYYFPIREYFGKDEKSFRTFLLLCAISALFMAIYSMFIYKQRMSAGLLYAYQLWPSRSVLLGPIFLLTIILSLIGIFHARLRTKLALLFLLAVNGAALLLTFTRTLWVFFVICMAIAMFFLRAGQNLRLIASGIAVCAAVFIGAMAYNPKLADIALTVVKNRISSSTQLTGGDYSFETRLIEAEVAWREIQQYPLGGSGIRSRILAWAPIEGWHNNTAFMHIGYVSLVYKVGFPTAILMFVVLLVFSVMAIRNVWLIRRDSRAGPFFVVSVGMFCFLPAVFVNIFMTGFFDQRYGNVMFAFIFACIAIVHDHISQQHHNDNRI